MPFDYSSIMQAQFERLAAEAAEQAAELEAGRLSEDAGRVNYAAARILELDAQRNALATRATQYASAQQAQSQRHPSGLSNHEIEIAKAAHSGGTVEERIRDYSANKQKLAYMRATGQYDDSQGKVKR